MADTVKIDLEENSKYRIAYELMWDIARSENGQNQDREYFLRLYRQCYDSVNGYKDIDQVATGGKKPSQNLSY